MEKNIIHLNFNLVDCLPIIYYVRILDLYILTFISYCLLQFIDMAKVSGTASARLRADYMRLKRDPVPYVIAEPLPSNILEW